jgi:hypothetical protein
VAKFDYPQTNFTAGEISPKLAGRWDIARYQNGAQIIENGVPVVHGGVDRRDGFGYLAPSKLNDDNGVRMIGFVYSSSQSYMLEFGHLYMRLFANNGAVILNSGLTPLELVSPYTRDQLAELEYTQRGDTLLLFHGDVPTQRLRRLSATVWSLQAVPWITEPFKEQGHVPDTTLGLSSAAVGAGRTFTAGAGAAPGIPTAVSAVPRNASAVVSFTPGVTGGGAISGYTVTSAPGGLTGTGTGSPIIVLGLTNGVAYTFTVTATNAFGTSAASAASAAVTPLGSLPNPSLLAVSITPSAYYAPQQENGTATDLPGPTASASGGTAPYSYFWERISGDAGLQVYRSNLAQLKFSSRGFEQEKYASFKCTATDALGLTGSGVCTVTCAHSSSSSGGGVLL